MPKAAIVKRKYPDICTCDRKSGFTRRQFRTRLVIKWTFSATHPAPPAIAPLITPPRTERTRPPTVQGENGHPSGPAEGKDLRRRNSEDNKRRNFALLTPGTKYLDPGGSRPKVGVVKGKNGHPSGPAEGKDLRRRNSELWHKAKSRPAGLC